MALNSRWGDSERPNVLLWSLILSLVHSKVPNPYSLRFLPHKTRPFGIKHSSVRFEILALDVNLLCIYLLLLLQLQNSGHFNHSGVLLPQPFELQVSLVQKQLLSLLLQCQLLLNLFKPVLMFIVCLGLDMLVFLRHLNDDLLTAFRLFSSDAVHEVPTFILVEVIMADIDGVVKMRVS